MLLAQEVEFGRVLFPVLIGMAGVAVLIGMAIFVRKKLTKADEDANDPMAGFSLGSLRQLVRDGKMTQEEFDATKARLVAGAQHQTNKQTVVKPERAENIEHKPPSTL